MVDLWYLYGRSMVGVGERPTIAQTLCRWAFEGYDGRSVGLFVKIHITIGVR